MYGTTFTPAMPALDARPAPACVPSPAPCRQPIRPSLPIEDGVAGGLDLLAQAAPTGLFRIPFAVAANTPDADEKKARGR